MARFSEITDSVAYTAVVTQSGSMIGEARRDVPGYTLHSEYGTWAKHDDAVKVADQLNREMLGLDDEAAILIVASSIRAQKMAARDRLGQSNA